MKNNSLLNWIVLLPVLGVLITSFILTNIYINSINKSYENEISELEKGYVKSLKQKIKNRIDNLSTIIDKNYNYQLNESKQIVKHFVNIGHSLINTIYENNKHKTKEEIYKIIDKRMNGIRFFDNKSGYYFIYDAKDAISISLPVAPSFVGKSVRKLTDKNKKNLFESYAQAMSKDGEGFDSWYWVKPNSDIPKKKIGYVKLFKPLNIVVGTAIYEEDIKQNISKSLVKIIEQLKFRDDGYIFVMDEKGTSVTHKNKKIVGVPIEELSPTIQNNVKSILSKLQKKDEIFMEYVQDKKLFENFTPSKKISYIKQNKELDWVLGTGLYTNDLNSQIKEKKLAIEKRLNENINLIIIVSIILSLIIVVIITLISKKIKNKFTYYSEELSIKNNELKKLNLELEEKVNAQVGKLREKDLVLNQQSKLAAMGEMLGNIAHQWRQPLSSISTLSSGIKLRKEMGMISDEQILNDLNNITKTTKILSQTIDDFRTFYSNKKEKTNFEIKDTINESLDLVIASLRNKNITVEKDIQEVKCFSYKNELVQVFLNIINNAKDALLKIEENKYIFIKSKKVNNDITIEFYDNAGGIDDTIVNRIFEPYFTTKHQTNGTGIGLYMSKNIIENSLNGKLTVQNHSFTYKDSNYLGAKFTIIIPIESKE